MLYSRMIKYARIAHLIRAIITTEELKALLDSPYTFYPDSEREQLVMVRKQPRRKR